MVGSGLIVSAIDWPNSTSPQIHRGFAAERTGFVRTAKQLGDSIRDMEAREDWDAKLIENVIAAYIDSTRANEKLVILDNFPKDMRSSACSRRPWGQLMPSQGSQAEMLI
jgi:adenylate kinase family enzyme